MEILLGRIAIENPPSRYNSNFGSSILDRQSLCFGYECGSLLPPYGPMPLQSLCCESASKRAHSKAPCGRIPKETMQQKPSR
jgi:hypothetical protein